LRFSGKWIFQLAQKPHFICVSVVNGYFICVIKEREANMLVRWEVEDGYAGKHRPQWTEIPNEELEGLPEDEREKLIEQYVQEDFEAMIGWSILGYEED